MLVSEWMRPNPTVISPKVSCVDAFNVMQDKRVKHLPVVDHDARLVGILTQKDLRSATALPVSSFSTHILNYFLRKTPVERVMSRQVISVPGDCPLEEAARILVDYQISCLPVLQGSQLAGIITETDIYRAMIEALGGNAEGLRITIHLGGDKGELGAITDGILQLGGEIISLSTFWVRVPLNRMVTIKLQGVNANDLIFLVKNVIGVDVVDIRVMAREDEPQVFSSLRPYISLAVQQPAANYP